MTYFVALCQNWLLIYFSNTPLIFIGHITIRWRLNDVNELKCLNNWLTYSCVFRMCLIGQWLSNDLNNEDFIDKMQTLLKKEFKECFSGLRFGTQQKVNSLCNLKNISTPVWPNWIFLQKGFSFDSQDKKFLTCKHFYFNDL